MHTLAWKVAEGVERWYMNDGVFPLPTAAAKAVLADALVVVGDRGLLVGGDQSRLIAANEPIPAGPSTPPATLTWHPERPPQPVGLGAEPTRHDPRSGRPPPLELVLETGEVHGLGPDPALVGRHRACGVCIDDPKVSSLHCLMLQTDDGVRVLDLQSRNGTRVNGARIKDIVLRRPSTLNVGDTRLWLRPKTDQKVILDLPSPQMHAIRQLLSRVAPADAPVLLQGECGVGKDGLAEEIHRLSGRLGRFVAINAAAITPTLAASELFGHVRGAFTGADSDREGAFTAADGGTLFLDEIGELPLSVQAELLRAVEQCAVRRVGDHKDMPTSCRLVVATNRNLTAEVRAGRFREDLFHRLCVIPVSVPPLRERPEDLHALVHHFLNREDPPRRLSHAALELVHRYPWPGNVRELLNVLRRAALLTDDEELAPADLQINPKPPLSELDGLIHAGVIQAYESNSQNVAATARALGMRRSAVYRHIGTEKRRRNSASRRRV